MKKTLQFLTLFSFVLSLNTVFAQIHISGTTTWGTDQILSQSVIIDPGGVLIIEQGVLVQMLFEDTCATSAKSVLQS